MNAVMNAVPQEKRDDKRGSVSFEEVTKSFGAFTAIPGLSLEIAPGTLVTLLGPSGCGKTTTLRMLAGLEHPTDGRILIGGRDVTALPANARDVSMVFQSYALFPHMTSLENVAYGLRSSGIKAKEARERAEEGLKLVGLGGMGARLPAELSGGQQQRVAVARALVLEPQVLLLDEPTSALDVSIQAEVLNLIQDLKARRDLTLVLVSHNLAVVGHMCSRVAVMNLGRIVEEADIEGLRRNGGSDPYTRELLAASRRVGLAMAESASL